MLIAFVQKTPVPAGANSPRVTTASLGAGTTEYTFESGHGVVLIKQLFGRPKDHPKIVCPLLDDVTATVSPP